MSAPDSWLDTGAGEAISAAPAITLHPALLLPVLVIYALDKQRELLITALANRRRPLAAPDPAGRCEQDPRPTTDRIRSAPAFDTHATAA